MSFWMDSPTFEGTLTASESSVVLQCRLSLALVSVASFCLPFRRLFSLAVRKAKKSSKRLLVYGRAKGGDACLTTLPQFEEDGKMDVRFPRLLWRGVVSLNGESSSSVATFSFCLASQKGHIAVLLVFQATSTAWVDNRAAISMSSQQ